MTRRMAPPPITNTTGEIELEVTSELVVEVDICWVDAGFVAVVVSSVEGGTVAVVAGKALPSKA